MKLHACRHCGSRLRTYTELQEHLKTHPNVCVICYQVFSNRSILLAHTCKVEEYLCEICQRSYSTQTKLARHKRETSCHHSLPPEAKRQKPMPPIEDLEAPPPSLVDEYGSELQNCCGRYLDEPSLITNADTFENFLERINEPDILKWALSQRPNSDWVVEIVTNATIFVNRILQHPIGCVGIVLPPYVKLNMGPNSFGERSPQQTVRRQSLSVPLSWTASRPRSKGALCQVHRPTS